MDKKNNDKSALSEADIKSGPSLGRRSLVKSSAAIVGVGVIGGLAVPTSSALATTDSDNGNVTDPGGRGRGYCRAYQSGVTDRDQGNISDPGGNGRGGSGQQMSGVTDSDNGPWTDPGGNGRGNSRAYSSGYTDSDTGGVCRDPVGNGRNI